MKILGIETSCDETAAAVVEDGVRLLSNVVSSQMDDFARYGGVIPEIAARSHIEAMLPVVEKALAEAGCTWDDIDAIGVTYAPGLIGSLMIGTLTARTLAHLKHKPLYGVHHVEGHVYANFLTKIGRGEGLAMSNEGEIPVDGKTERAKDREKLHASQLIVSARPAEDSVTQRGAIATHGVSPTPQAGEAPCKELSEAGLADTISLQQSGSGTAGLQLPKLQPQFPLLALIVSGGHTQLALFYGHGDYVLLGQAQDDAVGEAFDKVAKIIGLPYPGGVSISKRAPKGNSQAFDFPKATLPCPPGCSHEINTPVDDRYDGPVIRGGRGEVFARNRCHRYDFSFSGVKTAVLRAVQTACGVDHTFPSKDLPGRVSDGLRADVAASFQRTAVETLVDKTILAYRDYSPASVVIAGGVAANAELRRQLREALPIDIEYAPMSLCTDNAAMIASLAYFMAQSVQPADPYTLEAIPALSMTKTAWNTLALEP